MHNRGEQYFGSKRLKDSSSADDKDKKHTTGQAVGESSLTIRAPYYRFI